MSEEEESSGNEEDGLYICAECFNGTDNICSGCKIVSFCSKECQTNNWKMHKRACKLTQRCAAAAGCKVPASRQPQWSMGLSPAEANEWIVDCYRMSVDDRYVFTGNCDGLYDPDATPNSITAKFLVFVKLAVASGVLTRDWDWKGLLKIAANLLSYAFEKSDAREKYGGENVFSGRSLRATASQVYGEGEGDFSALALSVDLMVEKGGFTKGCGPCRRCEALCREVGGAEVWWGLVKHMKGPVAERFCD